MKVLVFSVADGRGGGSIGAMRMHKGLLNAGVDSKVNVMFKFTGDETVIGPQGKIAKGLSYLWPELDTLPLRLYRKRKSFMFSPSIVPDKSNALVKEINPDIVHLRWICRGQIKIESLKKYKKPIVLTMSDSWAFTGGCHLHFDCDRYKDKCGYCPALGSEKENDISRKVWERKKKAWDGLDLTIVSGSHWLAEKARESSLLKDKRIEVIPNGLDLNLFKPLNKEFCKDALNLPKNKKLITFGAKHIALDKNKNLSHIAEALRKLKNKFKDDIELLIFGSEKPVNEPDLGFKAKWMGHVYDETTMAMVYSASDIFVMTSLQENLPYTVMESLACGTPVVSFEVGGVPEMVEHKECGYIAEYKSSDDLAKGIEWCLEDDDRHYRLGKKAREKVENEFYESKQAQRYLDLYTEILNKKTK